MKTLLLGGKVARKLSLVAFVDDEDFERVSDFPWHPVKSLIRSSGNLSTWYVQGPKGILLHRFVLNISDSNIIVDHRNRNGLDCQKLNLRTGSKSQNLANRPKSRINTSGFKGVYARNNKWSAAISINNSLKSLGTFSSKEDAAKAYDAAAIAQWGPFAYTNFKKNGEGGPY